MIKILTKVIYVMVLASIVTNVQARDEAESKSKQSYAAGVNAAKIYLRSNADIDIESFLKGIQDQFENKKLMYTDKEIDLAMGELQGSVKRKSYMDNTSGQVGGRSVSANFFEQNKKMRGVFTNQSGLQYKVLKKPLSVEMNPSENDVVEMNYKAMSLNGEKIDGSERSKSVKVKVDTLIPGLKEAVKLMSPGAIWEIYIPKKLTHGCVALENVSNIEDTEALIYQLELLSIAH